KRNAATAGLPERQRPPPLPPPPPLPLPPPGCAAPTSSLAPRPIPDGPRSAHHSGSSAGPPSEPSLCHSASVGPWPSPSGTPPPGVEEFRGRAAVAARVLPPERS